MIYIIVFAEGYRGRDLEIPSLLHYTVRLCEGRQLLRADKSNREFQ
jgi:hypothetical protein